MAKSYLRQDTGTWYVLHGREKIRVGKSQRAAKHLASRIDLEVAEGRVGLYKGKDKEIESFFQEVIDHKKNVSRLKPKSIVRYQAIIKNFLQYLHLKYPTVTRLSQLDQTVFENFIKYRKTTVLNRNGSPVTQEQLKKRKDGNLRTGARDKTIRIEIQGLKSMLNFAVRSRDKSKRCLSENPLEYIESIQVRDEIPKRPLTEEEAEKFLSHLQAHDKELFEIFFTFIHTGLRDGELRHLEWSDVDLPKRMIVLREKAVLNEKTGEQESWTPKTKNGKREIPIHEQLYQILTNRKKRHKDKGGFVFPDEKGGILKRKLRRDLISVMGAIGIKDFTRVHDLRRTFISFMAMAGVPRETTMDMVGHVDEATYDLYRESTRKHRIESVNKLDFGVKVDGE